jgi:DNA-binding CsgD family transcriptional regulator
MEDVLDETIGALYEAAAFPEEWSAALEKVARLSRSRFAQLLLWNTRSNSCEYSIIGAVRGLEPDPANDLAYQNYYGAIDPRRPRSYGENAGKVTTCSQLLDESFVRKSEFYNDFMIPCGSRWTLGVSIPINTAIHATFAMLRAPEMGAYQRSDLEQLGRLLPHLTRAAKLKARLSDLNRPKNAAVSGWDAIAAPMIFVDGVCRLLFANSAAEELLAIGRAIVVRNGKVLAADPTSTALLRERVSLAMPKGRKRGLAGALRLPCLDGPDTLFALVAPVGAHASNTPPTGEPLATIIIANPLKGKSLTGRDLVTWFGLSQGEAQLALDLATGKRPDEIADLRGVRISTVRTQMHSLFAKTRTAGQTELVRLLERLPHTRLYGMSSSI